MSQGTGALSFGYGSAVAAAVQLPIAQRWDSLNGNLAAGWKAGLCQGSSAGMAPSYTALSEYLVGVLPPLIVTGPSSSKQMHQRPAWIHQENKAQTEPLGHLSMQNRQWAELLTRCCVRSRLTSLCVLLASLPGVALSAGLGLQAGRREGPGQSPVCHGTYSPWDRMGWVCGPPFQRDERGSQGAGLTSHGPCSALLAGVAGAGPGHSPALGCGEEVVLSLAAAQGARFPSGPALLLLGGASLRPAGADRDSSS